MSEQNDLIRWHQQDAHRAQEAAARLAAERDGAVAEMHHMAALLEQTTVERDALRAVVAVIQARHAKGGFCICGFDVDLRGKPFHGGDCPVAAYERLTGGA